MSPFVSNGAQIAKDGPYQHGQNQQILANLKMPPLAVLRLVRNRAEFAKVSREFERAEQMGPDAPLTLTLVPIQTPQHDLTRTLHLYRKQTDPSLRIPVRKTNGPFYVNEPLATR
jgi:hypothetical protein